MEIERPKSKHKKKKKVVVTEEAANNSFLEDVENDFNDLSLVDIDFPNLSLDSAGILEKNGKTSVLEEKLKAKQERVEETKNNLEAKEDVSPEIFPLEDTIKPDLTKQPSAPVIELPGPSTMPMDSFVREKINYPDLESLKILNEQLSAPSVAVKEANSLKPFTETQMQQLYSNNQLKLIEVFENEFISRELRENQKQVDHLLYQLLKRYARSRADLKINLSNLGRINLKSADNYKKIWRLERKVACRSGTCDHGHTVAVSHHYEQAIINEDVLESLSESLKKLLQISCVDYTKNSYDSELYKLQIEQIIRELLNSKEFLELTDKSKVSLNEQVDPSKLEKVAELRLCVSILFLFLRDVGHDKIFTNNVRNWIKQLASLQLRIATWQDHLFILYHILRCPVGVGNWASDLIQIPLDSQNFYKSPPFAVSEFQHCIALLQALLMPIKERAIFLEKITKDLNNLIDPVQDDIWVLVDSDGEEGSTPTGECAGLKENDLVALIDQIPFEQVFRFLTYSTYKDGEYQMDFSKITGHHLIKTIAFATTFIGILKRGLMNYDTERYKQFAKRLGRLTKNTIFFVADLIRIYRKSNCYKDQEECARIQVEFDVLVVRASNYIYDSQKLSLWQYLMDFPYELMNIKSLWSLYYFLHVGDFTVQPNLSEICSSESDFLVEKFNSSSVDVASDDLYFLLQSFCQMAMARSRDDWDFISCVTMNLLKIGFINESTRDNCYKTVKDLLYNITNKFPELISDILVVLKGSLKNVGTFSPYLCKALPISKWNPDEKDLEILAAWLLNFNYDSPESTTARVMFTNLNWNFNSEDELFLPYDLHVRMACLVCEVYVKHVCDTVGSGVQETIRLVSSMVKNQTKKEQFSTWCWNMISVLRLHYLDQNKRTVMNLMKDTTIMYQIPELEKTGSIYQAHSEQRPLGVFCSILVSQIGHSVPQICHKGFDQLKLLLNDYRYSKVIRCLELMTPLFLDCQESLFTCDSFQAVLSTLLSADKTYSKIAKDLVGSDGKGPVLNFFGNMLQAQLLNYAKFGLQSPAQLINLWIQSLTRVQNWNKDAAVAHLLDLIAKIAFQFPDCWFIFKEHFRFYFTKLPEVKVPKSSGLLTLISGSSDKDIISSPSEDALWLSIVFLELEFEVLEVQTGFWAQFLTQLHLQDRNAFVNVLKKSISMVNLNNFPQECLVIYKIANLITRTSSKHFLLPILCQQFFTIYLARVPILTDERFYESYGVQEKFYEADVSLMKKLKKALVDAENYYNAESLKEFDDFKKQFYSHCAKLFKTYLLWLEETQLNKFTQNNIVLPPQYDVQKLKSIFAGNRGYWTEYLLIQEVRESQKHSKNSWLAINYRSNLAKTLDNSNNAKINESPQSKIFARLQQFPKPKSIPDLVKMKPIMGEIDTGKSTLYLLRSEYRILENFAKKYNLLYKEHSSLDGNYLDTARNLYRNEASSRMVTGSCGRNENCSGGSTFRIEFNQAKLNENAQRKLEENRDQHARLIEKEISNAEDAVVEANFTIQNIVNQLLGKFKYFEKLGDQRKCSEILEVGSTFFYDILNSVDENVQSCPITHELCSDSISQLGTFVQQNHDTESLKLLKLALSRPNLVNLIAELFNPSVCPPKYFLEMYACICDSYAKRCDPQLLFVLLTKFDINNWLGIQKPKTADVVTLLQLILKGLELWNYQNSDLIQDLLHCHLINIFEYQSPQYFDKVIQNVLICFSNKRLHASVLLDLLNAFYQRFGCGRLETPMETAKLKFEFRNFASKQNVLSYQDIQNIILMLSKFFHAERLQHGLHGLYPIYNQYCDALALLLGTIGHSALVSAIHAYPGVIADQLINWLWPCIGDLFSPWLVPYNPQSMKDAPANWIKQFTGNNSILLPWSDLQEKSASKILRVFQMCLQFMFEMLPASNLLLSHLFVWYDMNFANKAVSTFVLNPVHKTLTVMPWERFRPCPIHMEGFNRILLQFVPECHVFVGNIFLRIPWTPWLHQNIQSWDYPTVQRMLSILLMVLIKLSYEPKIRESIKILTLLKESLQYPWHLLEYEAVESVFDWFVMSSDPSVILKIPTEQKIVDSVVLNLLQTAAAIIPQSEEVSSNNLPSQIQAKRILYVRSSVRLLKSCGTKLSPMLAKKEGKQMFQEACLNLLNLIADCFGKASSKEKEMEATNLMFEIVGSIDSHSESSIKLFMESIISWINSCPPGSLMLASILGSLSFCKAISFNVCSVLEATIAQYLKPIESPASPTWQDLQNKLGFVKVQIDSKVLIQNDLLLVLHWTAYSNIVRMENDVDRVSFLQNLQQHLADYKTNENNEAKLALLWGFAIVCGGQIMKRSNVSKSQLLIIARFFQVMTQQSEGWGEGLLGAIGLKKDGQTNKKKILSRCLACAIFALFSDKDSDPNVVQLSKEYQNMLAELKSVISNKKYADVRMTSLQAISLIESHALHMLDDFPNTITGLIHLFYPEDSFLTSTVEYWNF